MGLALMTEKSSVHSFNNNICLIGQFLCLIDQRALLRNAAESILMSLLDHRSEGESCVTMPFQKPTRIPEMVLFTEMTVKFV
jgi:hypothetical protein